MTKPTSEFQVHVEFVLRTIAQRLGVPANMIFSEAPTGEPTVFNFANPDQGLLLAERHAATCHCGEPKMKLQAFCLPCFRKLPNMIRSALYQRTNESYAAAYRAAIQFLASQEPPKEEPDEDNDFPRRAFEDA